MLPAPEGAGCAGDATIRVVVVTGDCRHPLRLSAVCAHVGAEGLLGDTLRFTDLVGEQGLDSGGELEQDGVSADVGCSQRIAGLLDRRRSIGHLLEHGHQGHDEGVEHPAVALVPVLFGAGVPDAETVGADEALEDVLLAVDDDGVIPGVAARGGVCGVRDVTLAGHDILEDAVGVLLDDHVVADLDHHGPLQGPISEAELVDVGVEHREELEDQFDHLIGDVVTGVMGAVHMKPSVSV